MTPHPLKRHPIGRAQPQQLPSIASENVEQLTLMIKSLACSDTKSGNRTSHWQIRWCTTVISELRGGETHA